jgi:hypothetical protein
VLGRDPMSIIIVPNDFVFEGLRIISIINVLSAYSVDRDTSQARDIVSESSREMGRWGAFVKFGGMKAFVE